jgi:4-carboxymuconolactone decarboxylase
MTSFAGPAMTLSTLDEATRMLVRLSARIAAGEEAEIRAALTEARPTVPVPWVEELILQSYLFSGFPRSLNAMREWRRLTGIVAPEGIEGTGPDEWRGGGEATCRMVYGEMYDRLRVNIRALHPELDEWMIVEGYGKVLSRPRLDLPRRELCIIAACAASVQDRQLHSHLHGALNVGVSPTVVTQVIDALEDLLPESSRASTRLLWKRVESRITGSGPTSIS